MIIFCRRHYATPPLFIDDAPFSHIFYFHFS